MKKIYLILLSIFILGAQAACAEGTIEVHDAHAYATSSVQKNGALFMVIKNTGDEDKILGASSRIAERIELHTHAMDSGVMMMREVEHYEVSANDETTLEPSGHHIMLMGLTQNLSAGEHFPLVLEFENHAPISVDVTIVKPGESP